MHLSHRAARLMLLALIPAAFVMIQPDLGSSLVADGLQLANRTVHEAGPDLLIAGDLDAAPAGP